MKKGAAAAAASNENNDNMGGNKEEHPGSSSQLNRKQTKSHRGEDESGFRRSSRLQTNHSHPEGTMSGKATTTAVEKGNQQQVNNESLKSPMRMAQALFGDHSTHNTSGQPKTLAAAIVSVLAEAEISPVDEDEDEEGDYYFEDDL
jgi:hypothetical protein